MTTNSPFEQAKAQYVHRYTMEHKPTWANKPMSDGRHYAPQYLTDKEWYNNAKFYPHPLCDEGQCVTQNTTWPLGQTLARPFRVGKPPEGFKILQGSLEHFWVREDGSERSKGFPTRFEAIVDAYQQPATESESPTGRLNKTDPQLQNISPGSHKAKKIREAFLSYSSSADFSKIESQAMKHLTEQVQHNKAQQQESHLIAAFLMKGLLDNDSEWEITDIENLLVYVTYLQALKQGADEDYLHEVVAVFGAWFAQNPKDQHDEACHTKIFELADDFFDDTEALIATNQRYLDDRSRMEP